MRGSTLAVMVALGLALSACGKGGDAAQAPGPSDYKAAPPTSEASRGEPEEPEATATITTTRTPDDDDEEAWDEEPAKPAEVPAAAPRPEPKVDLLSKLSNERAADKGGLGFEGDGQGGGGEGIGRIHGMGRVDTGGGRGEGKEERARERGRVTGKKKEAAAKDGYARFAQEGEAERQRAQFYDFDDAEVAGNLEKPAQEALAERDRRLDDLRDALNQALVDEQVAPSATLPRMFYFENTYLGGNAGYLHRMRLVEGMLAGPDHAHRMAHAPAQPFDAPGEAGMALKATLSHRWVEGPQRVILQVGLQGSERFGWRRPPLDMVLVVDEAARAAHPQVLVEAIAALVQRLGPADRLGVVLAGPAPEVVCKLDRTRALRTELTRRVDALTTPRTIGSADLEAALREAGALLRRAHEDTAVIPGTQSVVLLTAGGDARRVGAATRAAHDLTLQGAVTSVVQLGDGGADPWWQVADAGHGNYHHAEAGALGAPLQAELDSLAKVVARLLRLNVRLAKGVQAIRVLGTRVLEDEEVQQVKAREVAVDQNLSKTFGVTADRGDDDDGIQTVIPYFYGGDDHVVLIELWVEKPGPVADVTLKYKDMVALGNATARASVSLAATPRPETVEQRMVLRNVASFRLAEALADAGRHWQRGRFDAARGVLNQASDLALGEDRRMLAAFQAALDAPSQHVSGDSRAALSEALELAAARKLGQPAPR